MAEEELLSSDSEQEEEGLFNSHGETNDKVSFFYKAKPRSPKRKQTRYAYQTAESEQRPSSIRSRPRTGDPEANVWMGNLSPRDAAHVLSTTAPSGRRVRVKTANTAGSSSSTMSMDDSENAADDDMGDDEDDQDDEDEPTHNAMSQVLMIDADAGKKELYISPSAFAKQRTLAQTAGARTYGGPMDGVGTLGPSGIRPHTVGPRLSHTTTKYLCFTPAPEKSPREVFMEIDPECGLDPEAAELLLNAKMEDIGMSANEQRAIRFRKTLEERCTLERFNLNESGLGPASMYALYAILRGDENVLHLNLQSNHLIQDEGALYCAHLIRENNTLLTMDLQSNNIGMGGSDQLFQALLENRTLTTLNLNASGGIARNHVGAKGCARLSHVLETNQVIYHIGLHGNGVGSEGLSVLSHGLSNNCSLQVLDLGANSIDNPDCIHTFAQALIRSNVTDLNLSRNQIGDAGAKYLSTVLLHPFCSLTALDLSNNGITSEGCLSIGGSLRSNTSLQALNLSRNEIHSDGMRMLSVTMRDSRALQSLNLSHNDIDDLEDLMEAFRSNWSIRKLNLSHNPIDSQGAALMANALAKNSMCRSIDMSSCRVGDEGGVSLAEVLARANRTLTALNLRNNSISDQGAMAFAESFKANASLINIDLNYNNINYRQFDVMERAMRDNQRKHREGAFKRYEKRIEVLLEEERRLQELRKELKAQVRVRQQLDAELQEHKDKLEAAKEDMATALRSIQEEISAEVQKRKQIESEGQFAAKNVSRIRGERESKLRQMVQRLGRETESRTKAERRAREVESEIMMYRDVAQKQIDNLTLAYDEEHKRMNLARHLSGVEDDDEAKEANSSTRRRTGRRQRRSRSRRGGSRGSPASSPRRSPRRRAAAAGGRSSRGSPRPPASSGSSGGRRERRRQRGTSGEGGSGSSGEAGASSSAEHTDGEEEDTKDRRQSSSRKADEEQDDDDLELLAQQAKGVTSSSSASSALDLELDSSLSALGVSLSGGGTSSDTADLLHDENAPVESHPPMNRSGSFGQRRGTLSRTGSSATLLRRTSAANSRDSTG